MHIKHITVKNFRCFEHLEFDLNPDINIFVGNNGSGKSTLSKVLSGHPAYKVISGNIFFEGKDITEYLPEERSKLGIFLGFQYPIEIPGVSNEEFLRAAYNLNRKNKNLEPLNPIDFLNILKKKLEISNLSIDFLSRNVNEGFSGGEKKKK
jgi:Fe-S cluster assembly ATP-binding protein